MCNLIRINLRIITISYFSQNIKLYFQLALICFFTSCSKKPEIDPIKLNIDFLIEQGNLLWEQRTDSVALEKAHHFISSAREERPNDFELTIFLSKIKYSKALFFENTPEIQSRLFWEASELCQSAVLSHKDFIKIFNKTNENYNQQVINSLSEAPKSVILGIYWWAVNLGWFLNKEPVLERLKYRELLEVLMHRIISLEPNFYYSGPYRFFGSFYTRIPGIELFKSKTYFDQAIETNPEYFGNLVQMAEFYYQKSGERENFNKILTKVIKKDLNEYPELMSENFLFQKRASKLLEKEVLLFE